MNIAFPLSPTTLYCSMWCDCIVVALHTQSFPWQREYAAIRPANCTEWNRLLNQRLNEQMCIEIDLATISCVYLYTSKILEISGKKLIEFLRGKPTPHIKKTGNKQCPIMHHDTITPTKWKHVRRATAAMYFRHHFQWCMTSFRKSYLILVSAMYILNWIYFNESKSIIFSLKSIVGKPPQHRSVVYLFFLLFPQANIVLDRGEPHVYRDNNKRTFSERLQKYRSTPTTTTSPTWMRRHEIERMSFGINTLVFALDRQNNLEIVFSNI